MHITDQVREFASAVSAVILVVGVVVLAALGRDIPPSISALAGMAFTWLFLRSTQQAEHQHADDVAERAAMKEAK